jgi:hypothetical protein
MEDLYDLMDWLDAWRIDLRRAERAHAVYMKKPGWSPDDCAEIDHLRLVIDEATEAIEWIEAELAR